MGLGKLYFIILFVPCSLMALSSWQTPDASVRYNDICFLTSHNSYAAKAHGYYYAQQNLSIREQLNAGVRGLMLDTHKHSKSDTVILCHRNEWVNSLLCGGKPPATMEEALIVIREFLEKNPTEVITIFLENYVRSKNLSDLPYKRVGLEKLILRPSDWNPAQKDCWPTLAWMQKHNKRLVIFNSIEQTELSYNQWEHVIENQWGALPLRHATKERPESKRYRNVKRFLYVVNYFPRLKVNYGGGYHKINSIDLGACLKKALQGLGGGYCKERLPNFISLDFIDEGNGMHYVNEINRALLTNVFKQA